MASPDLQTRAHGISDILEADPSRSMMQQIAALISSG
jgi:hypothetical protein